eukprot:5419189-Pyramimonas_sp.AAC.1
MNRYAAIWRSVFELAQRRPVQDPPPHFVWTPAHLSLEEVLERELDPMTWIGNAWADLFAKLASTR